MMARGPNAEYRQASDYEWNRKTKETLAMALDDLARANRKQQHRMMSMEIIASRHIREGEAVRKRHEMLSLDLSDSEM